MLFQLHVISPRGDCIMTRDFRHDAPPGTADVFFRKTRCWDHGGPPNFYTFVKRSGMYFVFTSSARHSLCWTVELLNKLVKSFKDFCGVLSEESLRRNFILIYEMIDEIIDSGYPQTTASEILKLSVHSEAIDTATNPGGFRGLSIRGLSAPAVSTVPSWANQRPIGATTSASSSPLSSIIATLPLGKEPVKNEIFVDIMERLNVVLDSNGSVLSALIDGSIQMKSYLSGSPSLCVSLNEDLVIATEEVVSSQTSSSLILDDANFHECADLSQFSTNRILTLVPPEGEFVLMNYRISDAHSKLPFRIHPTVTNFADRVEISLVIRADLPSENYGSSLVVSLPVVGTVRSVNVHEGSFSNEVISWNIKKLGGGQEFTCRAKIFCDPAPLIGSISLAFEIPMYSSSNMQVRYLRIQDSGNAPFRWVRYVTQSSSYRQMT